MGKCNEKSGKLVEICTNFEELGGIWEYHQILSPKIVIWGGGMGIVGNWVANFRKNGVRGGTTIRNGRACLPDDLTTHEFTLIVTHLDSKTDCLHC